MTVPPLPPPPLLFLQVAAQQGLPITRVINRMELQSILADAVGSENITTGVNIVKYGAGGAKGGGFAGASAAGDTTRAPAASALPCVFAPPPSLP